jgi:hypothetical protein
MHQIEQVLISDEAWELRFACDVTACRGECCRIGDLGSPIDQSEVERITNLLPVLQSKLSRKQRLFLDQGVGELYKGKWHIREIAPNHPCPLSFCGDGSVLYCTLHAFALEQGLPIEKVKPLWCTLFPIVIQKQATGWLINAMVCPHCRSKPNSPPILLAFAETLTALFGPTWMEKVRQAYQTPG